MSKEKAFVIKPLSYIKIVDCFLNSLLFISASKMYNIGFITQWTITMAKKNYDYTITDRAKSHLERLLDGGGKRLVVDLDAQSVMRIRDLIEKGYGATQKDVVIKAIVEAHSKSSEAAVRV